MTGAAKNLWVSIFPDQMESFKRTGVLEPPPARHGHRYWPLKGSAAFPAMKRVRNPKDVILIPITFTCTSMMAMLRTCLV